MKRYRLILTLLLKNSWRLPVGGKGGKNGKLSQALIMSLSLLPLLVLLCVMLSYVGLLASDMGIFAELVCCVVASSQLFVLFFAAQSTVSLLYLAEDNAFLSALPARPSEVFFAKLTQIYLSEIAITSYVLLPALLSMSITSAVSGYSIFPLFYVMIPFIILLSPALPLSLVVVLSLPLMWIAKFFKRRAAMGTVVSILLFAVLFALYFAVIPNIGSVYEMTALSTAAVDTMKTISNVVYPTKALVNFALGIETAKYFGISSGIYVGLFLTILGLSSVFYKKAGAAQLETLQTDNKKDTAKYKSRGKILSLLAVDFKMLVRFPGLAISNFMGAILAPIMLAVLFLMSGDAYAEIVPSFDNTVPVNDKLIMVGFSMFYSFILNMGINSSAAMAYTREGGKFFILKHLPVSPMTSIKEKLLFADIVSLVGAVFLTVIVIVLAKVGVVNGLLYFISMLVFSNGFNAMSIYLDMRRPNLDWKITSEIQRNNYHMFIPFALAFVLGIVELVIASVLATTEILFGAVGATGIFWLVLLLFAAVFSGVTTYFLFDKGPKLFDIMGERQVSNAVKRQRAGIEISGRGKGGFLG